REFEKGYWYVNPTGNVASVALPQATRWLTHDNLLSALDSIPVVSAISLDGHNAAVLLKTDPSAPIEPGPASDFTPASRCFIATAAYGSPMATDVAYFPAFPDPSPLTNHAGRCFTQPSSRF